MLKSQGPPEREELAAPQKGGGRLKSQGSRRVVPGAQDKAGNLERGGLALPR